MSADVVCRGSFALGTACGHCSKCRDQIAAYSAMKRVDAALGTPSPILRRIAELEAENERLRDALKDMSIINEVQGAPAPWKVAMMIDIATAALTHDGEREFAVLTPKEPTP